MMEGQVGDGDLKAIEDSTEQVHNFFKQNIGDRVGREILEMATRTCLTPILSGRKPLPQRTIYIYVTLKAAIRWLRTTKKYSI